MFGQSDDFLIWSSSRSATASNSHALPYIVVELELLASDQPGAFFSRSIVKSNLELCSCDRPIAYHAPTTLTDDGITAAAAGPIQRPLLDPYCRRSDLTMDVVGDAVALQPPTEALQFDEVRFGRGLINVGRRRC